jgi:hypothetical protein
MKEEKRRRIFFLLPSSLISVRSHRMPHRIAGWSARRCRAAAALDPRLMALLTELTSERRYLTRIPVRSDGRVMVVSMV